MKVRVGDLTKIRTGKLDANASSETGEYPFFTCSKEPLKISTYSYDCECVLVAGNGDLNVKYYNGKFDAYQRTYIIEDNSSGKICMLYLYYYMESYIEELRKQSIGGVIKYIKLGNLTDALIELPSVYEQKAIVEILGKIKNIINKHNKEISNLDELIKARLVEMFGDPINNSKSFPSKKVVDVVTMQRGYDLPTSKRISSGNIPVYGSNGILGYHDTSKCDVGVITGRSGTLGEVTFSDRPFWPLNTTLFSVDIHNNNIIYLKYLLEFYDLKRFGSGTGVPTLNRNEFHNEPIIDVPLTLQNEFADFVKLIDKSKFINRR